jgi:hypothetical protein
MNSIENSLRTSGIAYADLSLNEKVARGEITQLRADVVRVGKFLGTLVVIVVSMGLFTFMVGTGFFLLDFLLDNPEVAPRLVWFIVTNHTVQLVVFGFLSIMGWRRYRLPLNKHLAQRIGTMDLECPRCRNLDENNRVNGGFMCTMCGWTRAA